MFLHDSILFFFFFPLASFCKKIVSSLFKFLLHNSFLFEDERNGFPTLFSFYKLCCCSSKNKTNTVKINCKKNFFYAHFYFFSSRYSNICAIIRNRILCQNHEWCHKLLFMSDVQCQNFVCASLFVYVSSAAKCCYVYLHYFIDRIPLYSFYINVLLLWCCKCDVFFS